MAENVPVAGKIGDDNQQARNRVHQHYTVSALGDGATTLFFLPKTPSNSAQLMVYVAGLRMTPNDRATVNDYALSGNRVTFTAAPANAAKIVFDLVAP